MKSTEQLESNSLTRVRSGNFAARLHFRNYKETFDVDVIYLLDMLVFESLRDHSHLLPHCLLRLPISLHFSKKIKGSS